MVSAQDYPNQILILFLCSSEKRGSLRKIPFDNKGKYQQEGVIESFDQIIKVSG